MDNFVEKKPFDKSINGIDLKNMTRQEKYELGVKDGLSFTLEKETELMQNGLYASGEYLKGLIYGIHQNPEQQNASKLHK